MSPSKRRPDKVRVAERSSSRLGANESDNENAASVSLLDECGVVDGERVGRRGNSGAAMGSGVLVALAVFGAAVLMSPNRRSRAL